MVVGLNFMDGRDRLQQVVNLGQPKVIHGVKIDVQTAERLLKK
jgi:hypothetical protein